jgi:L,D-transpeptidase ErfK/SrfK
MVPNGTQVRVVNQPFLFGWHDDRLYFQPYTVLEDDVRDWQSAQKKMLPRAMPVAVRKLLQTQDVAVDWKSVTDATTAPRGLPVPISGEGGSVEQVLAAATVVQNRIPEGSNWDGSDDTGTDGRSAQKLLSEREPSSAPAPASHAPGS